MEIIAEMEDEFTRKADFERIYPSENPQLNEYYAQFFEAQRYNNTLVNLWIQEHGVDGLTRRKKDGEGSRDDNGPRRPYGQRSKSASRPTRTNGRPSLVERQGLRRNGGGGGGGVGNGRQQMAAERLKEYNDMKLRMEGRERHNEQHNEESDRKWDRDWDAAHGHVDEDDVHYGDHGDDDDDDEVGGGYEGNSRRGGTGLSPKLIKAQAALDSAQSDFVGEYQFGLDIFHQVKLNVFSFFVISFFYLLLFHLLFIHTAIQEAMRAVVASSPTRNQVHQQPSRFAHHQQQQQQQQQHAYKQQMRELAMQQHQHNNNNNTIRQHVGQQGQQRHPGQQKRSPRTQSSGVRPQYVALAPGRDAVLQYQERQYRRRQHDQMRNYTGHAEVIQMQKQQQQQQQQGQQQPRRGSKGMSKKKSSSSSNGDYDVNLTGNRIRLGSRIESARTWANGRRPDYY